MSAQIIRLKEVVRRTGLGRSSVYKFVKEGKFPAQIKLGRHASGWIAEEVDNWIEEKIKQRSGL